MPAIERKPPLFNESAERLKGDTSVDAIYEAIYVAILEHRLRPGTKLGEEKMAEVFNVSRARIREVFAKLAHEQIVQQYPQRGAYIAKPSPEQARDVFEARRLIEPAILRRLIETLTPDKINRLRQHAELEADAQRRNDRRAAIRLSGEFHTLLADLAGNWALSRSMREFCILTCLIIFLYDAPTAQNCRPDEHSLLIDALAKKDRGRAEKLMLDHLVHIEESLRLDDNGAEVDLAEIFRT